MAVRFVGIVVFMTDTTAVLRGLCAVVAVTGRSATVQMLRTTVYKYEGEEEDKKINKIIMNMI